MTNDTQQTALELFAIALYEGGYLQGNGDEIQKLLEQYLEMEKEQIINANRDGVDMVVDKKDFISGKQYYNETYGGNK
jgi:hypothetical protein